MHDSSIHCLVLCTCISSSDTSLCIQGGKPNIILRKEYFGLCVHSLWEDYFGHHLTQTIQTHPRHDSDPPPLVMQPLTCSQRKKSNHKTYLANAAGWWINPLNSTLNPLDTKTGGGLKLETFNEIAENCEKLWKLWKYRYQDCTHFFLENIHLPCFEPPFPSC